MRVRDLIARLAEMPLDMDVQIGYGYGDYWHSNVSEPIALVQPLGVRYSEYHGMDEIVEFSPSQDAEREVVMLSTKRFA